MRVLYLGDDSPHTSSMDRARALERRGHEVVVVRPEPRQANGRWWRAFHYRTGYRFLRRASGRLVRTAVGSQRFDVGWVDGGRAVDAQLVRSLRDQVRRWVNYNLDDPFGARDGRCWDTYRQAVAEYDLLVVVRDENVEEARRLGARRVLRVCRGYDPVTHARVSLSAAERMRWESKVLFAGTWMPERGPFMRRLLERSVPVTIYGDRWQRAREWRQLAAAWKGPAVVGRDYCCAVQSSAICLGLLSCGNRDRHTQRSAEIPFLGGLLCAERTDEHQSMYAEGREAVFWRDADECAERCNWLLGRPDESRRIAASGAARVRQLGVSNDCVVERVIRQLVGDCTDVA